MFSESLQDNILLGLCDAGRLAYALHAAVLERDVVGLEHGLLTVSGPRGVRLSGGQVQRAAARMFVRDAELLVMDDLSSALDVETETVLWHRLFEQRDITCLAVSHRWAALRRADRVVLMEGGHVVAARPLRDLLAAFAEMRRLWHGDPDPSPPSC
jgi:ATP-binding cassette subfamily B protein